MSGKPGPDCGAANWCAGDRITVDGRSGTVLHASLAMGAPVVPVEFDDTPGAVFTVPPDMVTSSEEGDPYCRPVDLAPNSAEQDALADLFLAAAMEQPRTRQDVYVRLTDEPVDTTRCYGTTVSVDRAADGSVIGVEVMGAAVVEIDGEPISAVIAAKDADVNQLIDNHRAWTAEAFVERDAAEARIKAALALDRHEDWCPAKLHADCCNGECECMVRGYRAALAPQSDTELKRAEDEADQSLCGCHGPDCPGPGTGGVVDA